MKQNDLVVGQRWISDTEPELGLGIVVDLDARAMTVFFPCADDTRVYARLNAPLTRIQFMIGDSISDSDEHRWLVHDVIAHDGLLSYDVITADGTKKRLMEARLSAQLHLSRPRERLLAAQVDSRAWFALRQAALRERLLQARSPVRGLAGARVGLIAHQLSVANTVSNRLSPRVLLADEVGLGKTIEAGLIIHAQRVQGRAERVLILLPDSLVHQWLVEMRRRFNLAFSLFDLERCAAMAETGENPFASEQLIIAPLSLLTDHPLLLADALQVPWDMLVVDEAHHLAWSPEASSIEYDTVAALAAVVPSLLLLTATPEQLGVESHFARLQLLDPARYPSLDTFMNAHEQWDETRALADALLDNQLTQAQSDLLSAQLRDLGLDLSSGDGRQQALNALLDRYGLGRVLFRNTRAAVGGFPMRASQPVRLETPLCYAPWLAKGAIWPETRVEEDVFLEQDPRVQWLTDWLKSHRRDKCLLITRTAAIAEALETHLRLREGIRTAVFHEAMNLLERDRAAAYFAEPEMGAQILLCSEIGSEGRNFQFAHHLVLFDMPDNPDQLEQRIGRLDRIGQTETINLHVPLLIGSAQERLYRWYDEALNVFASCSPTAQNVHEHFIGDLKPLLRPSGSAEQLNALIHEASAERKLLESDLARGRDRLLELQSCRQDIALPLVAELKAQDSDTRLDELMLAAWEAFGVHVDDQGQPRTWILQPGEHQLIDAFPGLDPDGMTVCADRALALSHEDWHFLTWEHPMVQGVLDWMTTHTQGMVQVAVLRNKSVKPGTLLLEAWYQPSVQAPRGLALDRVLSHEPLRVLADVHGRNLAAQVSAVNLAKQLDVPDTKLARSVIKAHRGDAEKLISSAGIAADAALASQRELALAAWQTHERSELQRLQALALINPSVRAEEISLQCERVEAGERALQELSMQLVALRLIIAA